MIFFFFQAEDGIRDIGVTGVQTCALPIFTFDKSVELLVFVILGGARSLFGPLIGTTVLVILPEALKTLGTYHVLPESSRSEERRVGKECRSRWSPYH